MEKIVKINCVESAFLTIKSRSTPVQLNVVQINDMNTSEQD